MPLFNQIDKRGEQLPGVADSHDGAPGTLLAARFSVPGAEGTDFAVPAGSPSSGA
jgi:hypothetical protein